MRGRKKMRRPSSGRRAASHLASVYASLHLLVSPAFFTGPRCSISAALPFPRRRRRRGAHLDALGPAAVPPQLLDGANERAADGLLLVAPRVVLGAVEVGIRERLHDQEPDHVAEAAADGELQRRLPLHDAEAVHVGAGRDEHPRRLKGVVDARGVVAVAARAVAEGGVVQRPADDGHAVDAARVDARAGAEQRAHDAWPCGVRREVQRPRPVAPLLALGVVLALGGRPGGEQRAHVRLRLEGAGGADHAA
mmetsp:Transcript_42566/g.133400  ORF Transcript_42566/g.133400 Transcript_42566/m.133400 type:complete len:251 (-) Transcript_42566:257-1009(-)